MKTVYIANDDTVFMTEEACLRHESVIAYTVAIPVTLLEEAIRQCTPYLVTAKERRELGVKLKRHLPVEAGGDQLSRNP